MAIMTLTGKNAIRNITGYLWKVHDRLVDYNEMEKGGLTMEQKTVEINEESLERIAGGSATESYFKIDVDYVAHPKNGGSDVHICMTYAVSPDETVGHVEQRTIEHSICNGGEAQTYYHGAPVGKDVTMAQLGIKEYEVLNMELTLWGWGW